jgi:xanthine/CO dehydrogenase XdhC/CoxF family maturation factor
MWVHTAAALALARLARHQGLSQREVLERMIVAADDGILATLNVGEPAFDSYLGKAGRVSPCHYWQGLP